MEQEIDVPRPSPIASHKLSIIGRSFILIVSCQHALQANANTLDIVHGAPSLLIEQI